VLIRVVSLGQKAARMQTDLVQHARKVNDAANHVVRTAGQLFVHGVALHENILVYQAWQSLPINARIGRLLKKSSQMPTRNVNLTDVLDHFIVEKVKSGRYENASEVMRAALRALEREEQEYEAKLAALRSAIDAGDSSGIARSDVFRRVRKKIGRVTTSD
jgi:antitoxin ParD1/3/4